MVSGCLELPVVAVRVPPARLAGGTTFAGNVAGGERHPSRLPWYAILNILVKFVLYLRLEKIKHRSSRAEHANDELIHTFSM